MKIKTILFALSLILLIPCLDSCSSTNNSTYSEDIGHSKVKTQNTQPNISTPKTTPPPQPPPVPSAIEEATEINSSYHLKKEKPFHSGISEDKSRIFYDQEPEIDGENYGEIVENDFKRALSEPLSTFSLDVDRASYSNVRRMLLDGYLPPSDAVRIEEMINYFNYEYDQPKNNDPIAMHSNLTECPWNDEHQILHIGIQGEKIETDKLPPSNLVFLLDVSGSMNSRNKLPLVKSALKLLLNSLRPEDRVAIVTYAGAASIPLESTPVSEKAKILKALRNLRAGGSTAGAEGILSAYRIAEENFINGGNNRVILATDGDFNVGVNSADGLEKLIEKKRKSNIFLSVLGFGTGNYQDHQMQVLANKGNGNHAYIDNMLEAQKILVNEFGGTMFTIAKDVKIQIEFNPAYVSAYRLIGYENRLLNKEDFNDDTKDAGEIGSGHSMTAIYEIIPAGSTSPFASTVDKLKYQEEKPSSFTPILNNELATLKFRYKEPEGTKSKKILKTIGPKATKIDKMNSQESFALSVAEFGMLLRESRYAQSSSVEQIIALARNSEVKEKEEFLKLVDLYKNLKHTGE